MEISVVVNSEIEFSDIDMARWAWHGSYARFFEKARESLLKKINYDCIESMKTGVYWPIVDYKIKFKKALFFRQKIKIKAILENYIDCIEIKYIIYDENAKVVTTGYTKQVPVNPDTLSLISEPQIILKSRVEKFLESKN